MSGANDPPPSYNSLFQELATKKGQSDGIVGYTKEVSEVYSSRVSSGVGLCLCGILCSLIGIALPVTEIVIGSLYLKECPAQRYLPIYWIVAGVFGVLTSGSSGAHKAANRNNSEEGNEESGGGKKNAGGCFSGLVTMFLFAWFICGSVWVFRMEQCDGDILNVNTTSTDGCFTTDSSFSSQNFYCRKLLFDFTYYETVVKWSLGAVAMFVLCMVCCCACCVYCCSKSEDCQTEDGNRAEMGTANKSYGS